MNKKNRKKNDRIERKLTKRQFFSARSWTVSHGKKLLPEKPEPTIDWIYNAAFSHHVLERPTKTHMHHDGIPSLEKITHLFHSNFYQPILLRGAYTDDAVTIDQFFESITRSPVSQDTVERRRIGPNRVSVLIGRIGVGKSTFISSILIRFRKQFGFRKLFPVRIDVEALAGKSASKEEFFKALYAQLYGHLSASDLIDTDKMEALYAVHEPKYSLQESDLISKQFAIATRNLIIAVYHASAHRVMLVLDNVDKYYYLFDRGGFSEEGDKYRQESMEKLAAIIQEFMSPYGSLDGAGMSVVICVRRHTLDYLNARRNVLPGRTLNPDEDGSNVFHIKLSPPEDVVNSRIELLKNSLDLTGSRFSRNSIYESVAVLKEIVGELKAAKKEDDHKTRSMISDLSKLTSHGHRALIDHFAGYRWAFSDPAILRRFFRTYSPAVLTFMLNNNLRYSQVDSRFPNLFLVRGDVETPAESKSTVPKRLIRPHRHSYWLKYLIVHYIHSKKKKKQEVTPTEILDVFAPNSKGMRCYQKHIVELILGSLAQVDISAVIEPVFASSLDGQGLAIRDIKMTDRGEFLIDRFAFDFTYLQLVVEDYMLEFPDPVIDEFHFEKSDYSYFAERYDDYKSRTIEQVNLKSRVVFLFLEILEISLRFEMLRYPLTFDAIKAKGISLPNFTVIRENIVEQVERIAPRINDSGIIQRAYDNAASAAIKRDALEKFFHEAYVQHNV